MKKTLFTLALLAILATSAMAGTVAGIVTDAEGTLVEGANVVIRGVAEGDTTGCGGRGGRGNGGGGRGNGGGGFCIYDITDADGAYLLENVPAGTWTIHAGLRGTGMVEMLIDVPEEGVINVDLQLDECTGDPRNPDDPGNGNRHRRGHRHQRVE